MYLGRQPILDRDQRLHAYELLFRNGSVNAANITDGMAATATVIANAFSELGVEAALGNCRGFINVDEAFLFSDMLELLPREKVVLELLETVPPSPPVIARCRALRAAGFTLALDDVIELLPEQAELLQLVDIVKIDIQQLSEDELQQLTAELRPSGKTLLAEKVDSRAQMEHCMALGFTLFQGYYFARPTIIAGRKLDHSQLSLSKLLSLLLSDADSGEIEEVLKPEPGLTMNLLRLINSVGSGASETITSLSQAITVLGRRQLQRWLQLLLFASPGQSTASSPLLHLAATRGRLMELMAREMAPEEPGFADQAFMVGIMSLMPALVGQPIRDIVAPLGLSDEVKAALCSGSGPFAALLQLAECSEDGDLSRLAECFALCPTISPKALNRAQTEALRWASSISQERQG